MIEQAQRKRNHWQLVALATAAVAFSRSVPRFGCAVLPGQPTVTNGCQFTKLPDSVSQPALSPDGRMLTFVRGPSTF